MLAELGCDVGFGGRQDIVFHRRCVLGRRRRGRDRRGGRRHGGTGEVHPQSLEQDHAVGQRQVRRSP